MVRALGTCQSNKPTFCRGCCAILRKAAGTGRNVFAPEASCMAGSVFNLRFCGADCLHRWARSFSLLALPVQCTCRWIPVNKAKMFTLPQIRWMGKAKRKPLFARPNVNTLWNFRYFSWAAFFWLIVFLFLLPEMCCVCFIRPGPRNPVEHGRWRHLARQASAWIIQSASRTVDNFYIHSIQIVVQFVCAEQQ